MHVISAILYTQRADVITKLTLSMPCLLTFLLSLPLLFRYHSFSSLAISINWKGAGGKRRNVAIDSIVISNIALSCLENPCAHFGSINSETLYYKKRILRLWSQILAKWREKEYIYLYENKEEVNQKCREKKTFGLVAKFAQNMHSSWNGRAFNLWYSLLKAIFN